MRFVTFACVCWAVLTGGARVVHADSITDGRTTIDATDPGSVTAEHTVTWNREGGGGKELVFHLARGVQVLEATAGGGPLSTKSTPVRNSWLDRWTVGLEKPLGAGESREITLRTSIRPGDSPGIRIDAAGGVLAPGSGWFPAPSLETDELVKHLVGFRLPDGMVGVAAGSGGGGVWAAKQAVRPFAAWGAWTRSEHRQGDVDLVAYRSAGATGTPPGADEVAELLHALETGLGPAAGEGPWKLVDVGRGMLLGGARTLLWDEKVPVDPLRFRDVAGALAAGFWTESLRFTGPYAAFYGRAFPLYLGDAAAISTDPTDHRWRTYVTLVGPRRDEFARMLPEDRALEGLLPSDPTADPVLRTRGVLVAHMMEAASLSTSHFIDFVRKFREARAGGAVDDTAFWIALQDRFGNRAQHVPQFMSATDLPDFVLGTHEMVTTKLGGKRLKVEVTNAGKVADTAHLSTFSAGGTEMMQSVLQLDPGQSRFVLFGDPRHVARVEVDARRRALQSAFTNDTVELEVADPTDVVRPAFSFARHQHDPVWVTGLDFTLDGVAIRGFEGYVAWYATHHGPSGLLMFGHATVTVAPPAPHTESFREAMGSESVQFETPAIWVRFPPKAWEQIREQVESAEPGPDPPSEREDHFMFDHSFPTHFANGMRAEVPPPGGALVVLSLGGTERRAFVRDPKADGTVYARFWDQLRGVTLWEDTR